MQAWRLANPGYHTQYMRRYRRLGRKTAHIRKGLLYYYSDKNQLALEEFEKALQQLEEQSHLSPEQEEDKRLCIRKMNELREGESS